MYYLLRHLDPSSVGDGVLRFSFWGVLASFGAKEYFAITGLSFGPAQLIPDRSEFADRMLGPNGTTLQKDVEWMFISECEASTATMLSETCSMPFRLWQSIGAGFH